MFPKCLPSSYLCFFLNHFLICNKLPLKHFGSASRDSLLVKTLLDLPIHSYVLIGVPDLIKNKKIRNLKAIT